MKWKFVLSFGLLISSVKLISQPAVISFAPTFGPVGTTVVISGTSFSTTPASNIVYFGAVKAAVTSATTTSLTVTVPYGATYQPISVTTGSLTGYSSRPFIVTFTGGGFINENSFALNTDYATGLNPYSIGTADLDGDSNPDLVTANKDSNSLSVLRSITSGGAVSFAPKMDLPCTLNPYSVLTTDLDNDGMLDICVATFNGFSVYRNTSTAGVLSFEPRLDYSTDIMGFWRDIVSGDFDGDGRTDIVIADRQPAFPASGIISVYRNISTGSTVTFAPSLLLSSANPNAVAGVFNLRAADLDGDLKNDLVFTYNAPYFSVLKNASTPGSLVFNHTIGDLPLPPNCAPRGLAIGDLNADNKPDLAIADHFTDSVSIIKNISTPGAIVFDVRFDIAVGASPRSISINDLDGDGKPDLVTVNIGFYHPSSLPVSVFKCTSTGGNISFASDIKYSCTITPWSIALVDLNRDGKSDIGTANSAGSATASVLKNRVGEMFSLCQGGSVNISSNITGSAYQWQVSTDSISFTDLSDNSNYTGANTSALQLNNIPSSWYGNLYRCVVDGNNSTVYTILFTNLWTGATNTDWENPGNWSCGLVPDSFTDVIINSGSVILNSNTTIRSLRLNQFASLTVNPGYTLTVTH